MQFSVGFPVADVRAETIASFDDSRHAANTEFFTAEFAVEFVSVAADSGFSSVHFTEHPIPSDRWLATGGHEALDPFVGLSFMAALATDLRLLTCLSVLPYRNPFLTAKAVATLDRLSGGRVTLGVGAGYLKSEFFALGVEFDERNALFDEALDVCRMVWTGGTVSYEGRHFSARDVRALPTPVQDPLPIWIGGNSKLSRRRAAEKAEGWMPQPNPAWVGGARRTAVLETLRDLEAMVAEVHAFAKAAGRSRSIDVMFTSLEPGSPGTEDWRPARVIQDLRAQAELGVTWHQISSAGSSPKAVLEMIRAYGDEVISPLR